VPPPAPPAVPAAENNTNGNGNGHADPDTAARAIRDAQSTLLLAEQVTVKEIARRMSVSPKTVRRVRDRRV
jgi:DNA-binding NarL/FixJ family response regulator